MGSLVAVKEPRQIEMVLHGSGRVLLRELYRVERTMAVVTRMLSYSGG